MHTLFHLPTKILFGPGCSTALSEHIKPKRLLVVASGAMRRLGVVDRLVGALGADELVVFADVEPNPSFATVDRAAGLARELCPDHVLGIGGGSPLDVAKVVACLVGNGGSVAEYAAGKRAFGDARPILVAVPTTAGTGSEVSPFAALTDPQRHGKSLLKAERLRPDLALVDSELGHTMPPTVTAATGLDALCHAMEAFWSVNAQPLTDLCALRAIEDILENLPRAWADGRDGAARDAMAEASLLAGIAFGQTMTNVCHALSYALTTRHGLDHGFACAITLPAVVRRLGAAVPERFAPLLRALDSSSPEELAVRLTSLLEKVNAPTRLAKLGVDAAAAEAVCDVALAAPNLRLTPCKLNRQDLLRILLEDNNKETTG